MNGNTYRHPCVTAKMAATLDHISGGRLNLGIGAGWFELEHRDFGIDFKTVPRPARRRSTRPARSSTACSPQPKTTLHGKHYHVTDAIGLPKPVQQPHPPIMIGGTGEKVLLRIVAKHADMWNASASAERMRAADRRHRAPRRHACERDTERDREDGHDAALLQGRAASAQQFMCNLIAGMRQTTPEEARKQIMIGDKQECLDTVERYAQGRASRTSSSCSSRRTSSTRSRRSPRR